MTGSAGAATGGDHGTLSLPMAFCVALKQVIGGGVIVLTGTAVALTGAGAVPAYGLACVVILLLSLPYAVLGAAVPESGALYRWPSRFIAPPAGFAAFWLVLSTHVGLAAYAATFGDTLHALLPAIPARPAAIAVLLAVLALNLSGTRSSAAAGIVVTAVTAACLLLLAVRGLPRIDPARLTPLLPHGSHGLLTAAALLTWPISGATLVSELAGDMRRPARDVPVSILGATLCAAILYAMVALVAAGTAPAPGVDRPLDRVAAAILSPTTLLLFGLGTGVVSMLGIINAHMLWGSRSITMACRDGWLPRALGGAGTDGTPRPALLLLGAIGLAPILCGVGTADIVRVCALGAGISAILSVSCAPIFARREPDAYRRSALFLPLPALLAVSALAIASQGVTLVLLLRDLSPGPLLGWCGWVALGAVVAALRYGSVAGRPSFRPIDRVS
ncbi:MAG: amino acid permease [Gluconacetobacter diazotrophicus]|nr:amino acid permease [Gluconacetobacter diazotrophicus]